MLLGDDAAQLLMGADIRGEPLGSGGGGELLFAQIGNLLQLLRTFALVLCP